MQPKLLKTEEEYEAALARVNELMGAASDSPEREELDYWVVLIEAYEDEHYPMDAPDPITAIRFRMDQAGLSEDDLVPFIGSRSKVSEVLAGKRPLTLAMIRKLHLGLGIPADVLVQVPSSPTNSELPRSCLAQGE